MNPICPKCGKEKKGLLIHQSRSHYDAEGNKILGYFCQKCDYPDEEKIIVRKDIPDFQNKDLSPKELKKERIIGVSIIILLLLLVAFYILAILKV